MKDKSDLLFILYDHAANACLQAEGSVRSPDPIIVENLLCLKNSLQSLEEDIRPSEISENKLLRKLNELQHFNKFQVEMCGKINNVRQKFNYYIETVEEFEAVQRSEIILKILETYVKYFRGIRRKKQYSRKVKKCLNSSSGFSNVEACVVGETQTLSNADSCAGPYEQKAQNSTQDTILFEGETNYEISSPVKKKEKQISIDVFEDIELSAFFSCDSSNDEFTNGKEEKNSFDTVTDMSASDPPVEANLDDYKTSMKDKVNTSSFKTYSPIIVLKILKQN
ncbi:uncharacterized protein TNCT_55531 [Trichonephila clavata]|uniref:Uncharacterized protein n=1 Tax=Trichonephila clavata TaxID=2740835 RepID=A0A8X6M158_TRICU|nr:uncharacterized protein TNCT_55531 [Trichonephila clavata]